MSNAVELLRPHVVDAWDWLPSDVEAMLRKRHERRDGGTLVLQVRDQAQFASFIEACEASSPPFTPLRVYFQTRGGVSGGRRRATSAQILNVCNMHQDHAADILRNRHELGEKHGLVLLVENEAQFHSIVRACSTSPEPFVPYALGFRLEASKPAPRPPVQPKPAPFTTPGSTQKFWGVTGLLGSFFVYGFSKFLELGLLNNVRRDPLGFIVGHYDKSFVANTLQVLGAAQSLALLGAALSGMLVVAGSVVASLARPTDKAGP